MNAQEKINIADLPLVLAEQLPADFFTNPAHDHLIDKAIADTANLVYALDADGEKAAKTDAAAINKFATQYKKHIGDTVKIQTEEVTRWKDAKMIKVEALLANRKRLLDTMSERVLARLAEIRSLLMDTLVATWDELDVKPEYRKGDIEALVLYGSVTASGKLTAKALGAVRTIANGNKVEQDRIAARHMILENRCLKEGINPALTHVHLGTTFYADDATFNAKVDELIAAEIKRKEEMEARILREQEAKRQRELKEQQEAHERELQRQQQEHERELNRQQAEAVATALGNDIAKQAPIPEPENRDITPPPIQRVSTGTMATSTYASAPGKRTATFTATFEVVVSERVSNAGVETHFRSKLPEDLAKILKNVEFTS